MRRIFWAWPAIITASAAATGLLAFGEMNTAIRPALAFWFLLVCPGMAFVRVLDLHDATAEWTIAIALSIALDMIVAGALVYSGIWSPLWGLAILIGLCASGVILQLRVAYAGTLFARPVSGRRPGWYAAALALAMPAAVVAALVVVRMSSPVTEARMAAAPAPTGMAAPAPTAVPAPTAAPTARPAPTAAPPAAIPPTAPTSTTLTFSSALKRGSRGPAVALLQARLRELGFFSYPENSGYFGEQTAGAVLAFQTQRGLPQTGIAGSMTIAALNACDARCVSLVRFRATSDE